MKKLVKIKEIGRYEWGKNFKNKNKEIIEKNDPKNWILVNKYTFFFA